MNDNNTIEIIEPNEWVLYLHHEYHDADESQYVLLPDTVSYDDIYRTVAYIQHYHGERLAKVPYDTQDLSGQQMAYILHLIFGYKYAPLGSSAISNLFYSDDYHMYSSEGSYDENSEIEDDFICKNQDTDVPAPTMKSLNIFWNWEQGVMTFFSDKDSREQGKTPYFHPEINIDDYAVDNLHETLQKMDEHFKASNAAINNN